MYLIKTEANSLLPSRNNIKLRRTALAYPFSLLAHLHVLLKTNLTQGLYSMEDSQYSQLCYQG